MGDMIKGFFLLNLLILGLVTAYLSWLVLLPVSESDAEFRIANVCWLGQMAGSALNGNREKRYSCGCVEDKLKTTVPLPVVTKGSEALRKTLVAVAWRAIEGDTSKDPDTSAFEDRDVVRFVYALKAIELNCAMSAFGPVR